MADGMTPCQITSEIVRTLTEIAGCIGQLEGVSLIQPDPQLHRKNRIRTIQASLAIEGNSLMRDQITALLDKKRVVGPPQEILEVQNAITVYRRLPEFNPLEMDSFLSAHGIMMKGLMKNPCSMRQSPIGTIRKNDIFNEAPDLKKVDAMILHDHALWPAAGLNTEVHPGREPIGQCNHEEAT